MWCLVFSVGSCMSCAEFTLGCVSVTGLMDELPQFRAGCRPLQLLVYHRAFQTCANSLVAGRDQGKATHPTLAQEGWRIWAWAVSNCWWVFRPHAIASASTLVLFESPAKVCALLCCSCVNPCPEVFSLCWDWTQQESMECKGRKKGGRCWREEGMGLHRGPTLTWYFKKTPAKHNNKLNRQKTRRNNT